MRQNGQPDGDGYGEILAEARA